MAITFTGETLDTWNIIRNILYSFMLFLTGVFTSVGLATYGWMETTAEAMEQAGIRPPPSLPGLTSVSCGLFTYCLDAAGEVSECSLPWPQYGEPDPSPQKVPVTLWKAAAACIIIGMIMVGLCFIYSIFACFGCYSQRIQRWSTKLAAAAGFFMLIGLLIWMGSFGDMAVTDCYGDAPKIDDPGSAKHDTCDEWKGVFPRVGTFDADGKEEYWCRICNYKMKMFVPSTECKIGWGAILVIIGMILSFVSGCVGEGIRSKQKKIDDATGGRYSRVKERNERKNLAI